MMLEKSRDIWINDYFSNLQLEYLSYYARFITYDRPEHKKMFSDICKMKYEKIVKIAFRNNMSCIFTNVDYWNRYLEKWMGDGTGLPNFQYRDKKHKRKNFYWDAFHYFAVKSLVEYEDSFYPVVSNNVGSCILKIAKSPVYLDLPYSAVNGRGYRLLRMTDERFSKLPEIK